MGTVIEVAAIIQVDLTWGIAASGVATRALASANPALVRKADPRLA
jgi:type IV secretory pathway TrbD component